MLMYRRHLHFLRSLGEERAWYLLRLKETILGTGGWSDSFGLQSPCFLVKNRNVREPLWLQGPQESSVNLKALTSGYSLPLFAFSSAHRRPPWLWIQGWPSLLYARPGEVGILQAHLVQGEVHCLFNWPLFLLVSALWKEVSVATSTHSSSFLLCLLLLHQLWTMSRQRKVCAP